MNKPVTFICVCIAGLGLLVLGRCAYCAIVYGHGDLEAGNFHRCIYWTERDPVSGAVIRCWDTDWALVSGTEQSAVAQVLDMWFVGLGLLVLGGSVFAVEHYGSRRHYAA
ncbi:MAG TPA: hypothetical protein P5555_14095 [Candidatus Paceibacterota bacterium]|nr:hypothetical protein [Verrucomicrobiota bacterium]HRZ46316.1 hypothetical protein [Candidatus Paceibacterota bacterium]